MGFAFYFAHFWILKPSKINLFASKSPLLKGKLSSIFHREKAMKKQENIAVFLVISGVKMPLLDSKNRTKFLSTKTAWRVGFYR
jgi:hypothetical protein